MIYVQLLLLIVVANGVPLLGSIVFGNRLASPLDCGLTFLDGRPLLGPSKTFRGCALSAVTTFAKRRLGRKPGNQALGLDQVPESLLPLLVVQGTFDLSLSGVLSTVIAFIIIELGLPRCMLKRNTSRQK